MECSIHYSWSGGQIIQFQYHYKEDNIIEQGSVIEHEIIYIRGNYNVNVAAVIGDNLIGEVSTTEVHNKGEIEYI